MKRFKFLFSFITLNILLITAISAQWLETTIYLPDSSGPYALGYNSVNNKIYCANFGFDNNYDSTVTVIDGATNNIITTLNTGYRPYSFCYNPTNNKVYCINLLSGTLTVINGEFDTIITTLAIGNPVALCYDNINNVLLCANSLTGPGELKLIDGNTNQVLFSIEVGAGPRAFTWNPIQNRTYVANYLSSSISVIRDMGGGFEERQTLHAERLLPEIYPNPATSVLRVRYPWSAEEQTDVKIFDVSGKVVREIASSTPRNDRVVKISLKGIKPGIYFLKLGKESKKFLVVK